MLFLLRRGCWRCLIFLLPVQHLAQHIAQVRSCGRWRSLRLLPLIAADRRTCGLLLVLLLLLAADCVQNPANATLLLVSSACISILILITKNCTQNSGG